MNKEQYIIKLNQSIIANNIDNVKLYFEKIENKNIQNILFFNAIKYAILKDFNEVTNFIFKEINKNSEETIYKIKELSELSSRVGNLELVKLFCENYVLVNESDIFIEAVSNSHIEILTYLISKKNLNILNEDFSFLVKAAETGNLNVFKLIFNLEDVQYYLKSLNKKDNNNKDIKILRNFLNKLDETILTCTIYDMSDILDYILNEIEVYKEHISDFKPLDSTFVKSANYNSVNCLKICLSKNYLNPTYGNNSSVKTAFKKGFIEIYELLIQQNSVKKSLEEKDKELYQKIKNSFVSRNF